MGMLREVSLVGQTNRIGYLLLQQGFSSRRVPGCNSSHSLIQGVSQATGHRKFSSIAEVQEGDECETKWHQLPPVPRLAQLWTASELHTAKRASDEKNLNPLKDGVQQLTALRWVTKCCPTVPHSLLQKLFRLRQIRKRDPAGSPVDTQHGALSSTSADIEKLNPRLKRVSGKTILEEGTVVLIPKSVSQVSQPQTHELFQQDFKKTQHLPTAGEIVWLQSLVLYKDSGILVINKPPGLPVQGGSEIKRSLDSLMGKALCFDYNDGPRLVHRLDKETSGILVLARTQECAILLHSLFRDKTTTATERHYPEASIERFYWALVIGTPKEPQGRISVPLIKVVLDEGKGDKIMVAHDPSGDNAQVAITDYQVISSSYHGCTWLELHPRTGRKHQLRVHCAEVLGTPVVGDTKYGWRTQREWLENVKSREMETLTAEDMSAVNSEWIQATKRVPGSVLSKLPRLHLHCGKMNLPNVVGMLERNSILGLKDRHINSLQFGAPLPPHIAASRDLWSHHSRSERRS